MSQQWYVSRQGKRFGPYSHEQLVGFARSGQVVPQDLVWGEGMPDWVAAGNLEGLFQMVQSPAVAQEATEPLRRPAPYPSEQPAGVANNEPAVGIIPGMRRKTGLLSSKLYTLVVTGRRTIFAEATTQMFNQAAKEAAAEAKAQGKGFFARAADTMRSAQRIYQKYLEMAPEAILAETSGNYYLEHRDIVSIRIRRGMYREEQGQYDKDEMHIKTNREKFKLFFEQGNSNNAKKLLQEVLGKVVR